MLLMKLQVTCLKSAPRNVSYMSWHTQNKIISLITKQITNENRERCGKLEVLLCISERNI